MSKLKQLEAQGSDRATINRFLGHINETDSAIRAELIEICSKDKEARSFWVGYANSSLQSAKV